jgi:DNA-binding NarL/FixJ family response regulator
VLGFVAEGHSNRAIADRLMISVKTVQGSIAAAFMKLGLDPDPGSNRRVLAVLTYLEQAY